MLGNISIVIHSWLVRVIGRDWLEYLLSNTMNVVTERLDPFLWSYDCKAKIVKVIQETQDSKTFILLPNQHFKQPLPGQHVELSIDVDGEPVSRCYTLSVLNKNTVAITVKLNPEGRVSKWLHESARVGEVLNLSSPRGSFVYKKQKKILFISAGSGITPCFSILSSLSAGSVDVDVALYYRSRSPVETIFKERLDQLALNSKVKLSYSQSKENDVDSDFSESGQLLPEQLMIEYPDLCERHIYLCGPDAFKNRVLKALESFAYDFDQLEVEHFGSVALVAVTDRESTGDVEIRLVSQNRSFVIKAADRGKTILESAEENGVYLEHGCRSGMCGTCKTNVVSGDVLGVRLGRAIYPCSAYPNSTELVLE